MVIAAGYIEVDMTGYGGFSLAEKGLVALKRKEKIPLRKDPMQSKMQQKKTPKIHFTNSFETQNSEELWEDLRRLRLEIANDKGIPPFVIFHDKTLAEIVSRLPQTLDELSDIYGVGQKKLDTYGKQFLDVVIKHVKNRGDSSKAED
jgi:ATP-dependent DNA helicase RecQ